MPNPNLVRERKKHNRNQKNERFDCNNIGFEKKVQHIIFNKNQDLPFFTYGIFKPGQLAYSRIEKYVDSEKTDEKPRDIPYRMYIRDGIPLIVESEKEFDSARGYLIYFKKGCERNTYLTISKTLSRALYEWKEIEVDGIPANVLIGLNPERGISRFGRPIHNFRGEEDPYFDDAINLIAKTVKKIKESDEKHFIEVNEFLDLQMNYMLLWSAIDRYTSLKYNIRGDEKVVFAKEYSEIINRVLKDKLNKERIVYNSETLWCNKLNPENPVDSLFYYYTIRCNVVHKGKGVEKRDYDLLADSLVQLYTIFKEVLDETFRKNKRY